MVMRAAPALPSLDLDVSILFYQALGFTLAARYDDDPYAILTREGAELHLWLTDDHHVAENSGCYLRVDDADVVWREWRNRGIPRLTAPEDKPWGTREFQVLDPSGNLIRVGSRAG
jgi:catechol 2,3-dioxygenase-like lactoylglutathione lyase family enzyme